MRRTVLHALLASLACAHSEPFPPQDHRGRDPFDPAPPVRLTLNRGSDDQIGFTPDGRDLLYTINGFCLGFLPAHETRDRRWLCAPEVPTVRDSYSLAVLSSTGRLAWVLTRQRAVENGPFYHAVLVAPLADLRDSTELTPIPFRTLVDSVFHQDVSRIAWLGSDTLAVLTDQTVYLTAVDDTTRPRGFIRLDLPPVADLVSGPDGESVSIRPDHDIRILVRRRNQGLGTLLTLDNVPQAFATAPGLIAVAVPDAVQVIPLPSGPADTIPTGTVVVSELALSPDGSDLIAAGVDTAGSPSQLPSTDLFRLVRPAPPPR